MPTICKEYILRHMKWKSQVEDLENKYDVNCFYHKIKDYLTINLGC